MIKTFTADDGLTGRITLADIQGQYFPPSLNLQGHAERLKKFQLHEDDVIICSYPKSGYHWVWEIATMLKQNTTDVSRKAPGEFILDFGRLGKLRDIASPRVFGCHSPYEYIADCFKQKNCKIINVIRDPRSAAVSAYHFYRKLKTVNCHGDWSGFLNLFLNGKVPFNDWFTFARSWEDMRRRNDNGASVFVLHYEDLLMNPQAEIKRLAQFLQADDSDSFIQKVADATNFRNLKPKKDVVYTGHNIGSNFENKDFVLYRKGDMDDWKSHFTLKQNEDFEKLYAERMKGYDLKLKSMISQDKSNSTGCVESRSIESKL